MSKLVLILVVGLSVSLTALSAEELSSVLNGKTPVLILFTGPKCRACADFLEEDSVKKGEIGGTKIKLFSCEGRENSQICNEKGVRVFPSLALGYNGTLLKFFGQLRVQTISDWLRKKMERPYVELKDKQGALLIEKKTQEDFATLLLNSDGDAEQLHFFEKVAYLYGESVKAYVVREETAEALGFGSLQKGIYLKRNSPNPKNRLVRFPGKTEVAFARFFAVHRLLHLRPLTLTGLSFPAKKFIMVLVNRECTPIQRMAFRRFATSGSKMLIFEAAKGKYSEALEEVSIVAGTQCTCCVVLLRRTARFNAYKFLLDKPTTPGSITRFVEKFQSKRLQPHFKEVPIKELGPGQLSARNLRSTFHAAPAGSLVLFYSSSASQTPLVKSFLDLQKRGGFGRNKLWTFDLDRNDLHELKLSSAPTLMFVPPSGLRKAQEYKGPVTFEAVRNFFLKKEPNDLDDL